MVWCGLEWCVVCGVVLRCCGVGEGGEERRRWWRGAGERKEGGVKGDSCLFNSSSGVVCCSVLHCVAWCCVGWWRYVGVSAVCKGMLHKKAMFRITWPRTHVEPILVNGVSHQPLAKAQTLSSIHLVDFRNVCVIHRPHDLVCPRAGH